MGGGARSLVISTNDYEVLETSLLDLFVGYTKKYTNEIG
jgi:hypothetical protein